MSCYIISSSFYINQIIVFTNLEALSDYFATLSMLNYALEIS